MLDKPLKELVNEAIRRGLVGMPEPCAPAPYRTQPVDLGRCRLPNVDDVGSALALEHGLAVVSAAADVTRFPGIRLENPVP